MTNVKVGMKLYRNVEEMTMAQLSEVTKHIEREMKRLEGVNVTRGNGGALGSQINALMKHAPLLQRLAKKRLDEHLASKPLTVENGEKE